MQDGTTSYLPTGRAGDNNGEDDIDTQHKEKRKAEEQNSRTEKK